ncbi:unnamed protein product [Ectocarpus sp. 13 AM-2016]
METARALATQTKGRTTRTSEKMVSRSTPSTHGLTVNQTDLPRGAERRLYLLISSRNSRWHNALLGRASIPTPNCTPTRSPRTSAAVGSSY